jgi:ADP-ribosyl-[dinitrogen reductase] hydrolase
MTDNRQTESQYRGCLLGGAIGDALGAAIEFDDLQTIRAKHGPNGLTDYSEAYGGLGKITDDTQMLLFVAEGLVKAQEAGCGDDIECIRKQGYLALLRWLQTQFDRWKDAFSSRPGLLAHKELYSRRAPGNTCMSSLRIAKPRSIADPINFSKGCGGIMRIAPVGLMEFDDPFIVGAELAALSHGHPAGYLSAGFMAQLIHQLVQGDDLRPAIEFCLDRLHREPDHQETTDAVMKAMDLAKSAEGGTPEDVETLGGGWVGEEALSISLCCALMAKDFEHGVLLAVNHGGDSDSTGSITGNMLGLIYGDDGISPRWKGQLELHHLIEQIATDLHAVSGSPG